MDMDNLSLAALLDEDREMVTANLARDRALAAAQAAMERAIDRVMYRYVEGCGDAALRDCAQLALQTMKNTLPVMDTVGESRAWKRTVDAPKKKGLDLTPATLAILIAGAVLVLAAALGAVIGGRSANPLAFLKVLLPSALGGGCLFWAGARAAKPARAKADAPADVRTEYLVDVDKAWHCLRGAMLQADGQLARVRQESAAREQRERAASPAGGLSGAELDLFAGLLESAYAEDSANAREAAADIRFFLHNAQVDVVDFQAGREGWFEFLPAARPGTIRPALAAGGRLLKKGLAST